jgi:hypothetical protein
LRTYRTLTFQRAVERKTATAYQGISYECDQKHSVVFIFKAIPYAFHTESDKQQVRERVNNLRTVDRGIVILCK